MILQKISNSPIFSSHQVQLDSELSELNESMISSGCFECEETLEGKSVLPDLIPADTDLTCSDDMVNSNMVVPDTTTTTVASTDEKIPDEMISSTHSTFDTEIVYRRRAKKTPTKKAPKKRVSFHEDILKNTKTDNIHIEHGFITYKNYPKKNILKNSTRYSWCSEYGGGSGQLDVDGDDDDEETATQVVYRNACSDVLDYGQTEVFMSEDEKRKCVQYDNSGVFEYSQKEKKKLYKCECSDSNSSLDSGSDDNNANVRQSNYPQSKSNSCECIGGTNNQVNNNVISDNCYYSEPNIEYANEFNQNRPRYTWSKEKKPKSSCLKKTKYTTSVIPEYNLNKSVKKFNVHHMTQIFDNSKAIIGSLKDIFGINMPERGVPEGSEDLQVVAECVPETPDDTFTVINKPRPFLSKSLDGVNRKNATKNYVHNVDEQLRGKNDEDLYAPTRKNSEDDDECTDEEVVAVEPEVAPSQEQYRNKYIINCESTVFEHTGVSFVYNEEGLSASSPLPNFSSSLPEGTPSGLQLKKKLSNIITGVFSSSNTTSPVDSEKKFPTTPSPSEANKRFTPVVGSAPNSNTNSNTKLGQNLNNNNNPMESSMTSSCSGMTDVTSSSNTTTTKDTSQADKYPTPTRTVTTSPKKNLRHLSSPLRKNSTTTITRARMTPDLFNMGGVSKGPVFSDEFDDILTVTTTTTDTEADKADDLVILDYPSSSDKVDLPKQYLKPPGMSSSSSKTSLINRFLRNVTQKKILEATIKKNNFFQTKLNNERSPFGNLYFKGVKKCTKDAIEDMNAEIAMEVETSIEQQRRQSTVSADSAQFECGVGEISMDTFAGHNLNILRNDKEILMKAFKLYTGYSRDGYLTPVLVFLTDKTLYVTEVIRNRLSNKFVLPYIDLDVILMGPFGNTVLLSNSVRDMQQVLLAGGPYPAEGLVASLEMCARRGGSTLPAVGQLTLEHLAPLQAFVRDNSSINKEDVFKYYAVVNVPAGSLSTEKEPLGPYLKGFLMHRSLSHSGASQQWSVGYFLLKAGVLYLFSDSGQKLPTWAVALAECQGARRALKTGRPHCFELLLRTGSLQLAAPDEYVASEWLQALVQAASGLFEMQDRHKTLGCTLIMTNNHLITLREDFSAPLRRLTPQSSTTSLLKENVDPNASTNGGNKKCLPPTFDNVSEISSIRSSNSTPSKQFSDRKSSSSMSTPTKLSVSTVRQTSVEEKSYTNMTSFYGKNSGVEILTCAAIDEMVSVKIPTNGSELWCILVSWVEELQGFKGRL